MTRDTDSNTVTCIDLAKNILQMIIDQASKKTLEDNILRYYAQNMLERKQGLLFKADLPSN